MSNRAWLDQFLSEAAREPGPLFRTIATARRIDLAVTAAAIDLVPNPAVRVLGYAALGRRSPDLREQFLSRAVESAESLPDPESRAGVLVALIDALSPNIAPHSLAILWRTMEDLPPGPKQHYMGILKNRIDIGGGVPTVVTRNQTPQIRIDPDVLAAQLATVFHRTSTRSESCPTRIRPLGPAKGRSRDIRLAEIADAVGIDPRSFSLNVPIAMSAPVSIGWAGESPLADAEPTASMIAEMTRPERVVSTGFADSHGTPEQIVVRPGDLHFYFIEIGARVDGAAESGLPLPDDLQAASLIDVVVTTSDDGLTIEGPRTGCFRIEESGTVIVLDRACVIDADEALLRRRMFFAFRAPPIVRHCNMRCSLYCRGSLIQSRHISVPVGTGWPATVRVDYIRSRTLSPGYMSQLERPRLSVMLNRNADGTHSFRFYANEGKFERSSTFRDLELKDHIARARKGYRQAAWGTPDEWTANDRYRFRVPRTIESFTPDLLDLARRGRVLWDAVIDKLAGGPDAADALRELMRQSGQVQFALKEAANAVLPIAILYDHELDVSRPDSQMQICSAFVRSLGGDLAEAPCFVGDCPNRDRPDVVCPGGFWGYRHAIGLPVSIGADQSSPTDVLPFLTSVAPSLIIGVSTDPTMSGRGAHLANLWLKTSAPQEVAELRDETVAALKTGRAPIVYFYCHGGMHNIEGPFIEVGPRNGPHIARNDLRAVRWKQIRPLVFINGCHTTGVSPEDALELVSAFVATSGASGVIGTEITVFESLASAFAEAFFVEFVGNGRQAGEAIRRARLRLLKDSLNPLGLIYIPFVESSLRLLR